MVERVLAAIARCHELIDNRIARPSFEHSRTDIGSGPFKDEFLYRHYHPKFHAAVNLRDHHIVDRVEIEQSGDKRERTVWIFTKSGVEGVAADPRKIFSKVKRDSYEFRLDKREEEELKIKVEVASLFRRTFGVKPNVRELIGQVNGRVLKDGEEVGSVHYFPKKGSMVLRLLHRHAEPVARMMLS